MLVARDHRCARPTEEGWNLPLAKVSDSTVREILQLHRVNTDPATIAETLDLRKAQVAAIIAHDELKTASARTSDSQIPTSSIEKLDTAGRGSMHSTSVQPTENELEEEQPPGTVETGITDDDKSGVSVGDDREFGDLLYWTSDNAAQVQNPHLMIVGESGSGKTYTVRCLIAELAQRNIPSIIFDYGQGFEIHTLDESFCNYAVARIEAAPAVNPSFWIKGTKVEQVYLKVADFWLPASNRSTSNTRLGGSAVLTIEYKDYQVTAISTSGDSTSAVVPTKNSVLTELVDLGSRGCSFSAI
ncbi:MAG: DUF87 domain-containing protein [Candidatus Sulfotelmatobacter sp.]